jgi:flagellar hook-basal body complex protein FliE
MSTADINQVLAQMRVMAAQAAGQQIRPQEGVGNDFSQLLKQSIDNVNEAQMEAGAMKKAFETGQGDMDLAEVMIAIQKSSLSFETMVQVRNKLVDAYKDVMNMPI